MYNRSMTNNNNTNGVKSMTKKFLTEKQTEGMTLEQFQAAMREGKIEIRRESMDNVTADMVTMNGKFSCD